MKLVVEQEAASSETAVVVNMTVHLNFAEEAGCCQIRELCSLYSWGVFRDERETGRWRLAAKQKLST